MLTAPPLVLYGSSGYGVAIADVLESWLPEPVARIVGYIDDVRGDGSHIGKVPVMSFATWVATLREISVFVTLGKPSDKRMLVERVTAAGGRFASFYRIGGPISRDIVVGEGTMILAYASIGAGTVLGRHVHVMPLASIDAQCTIGDFSTLAPMTAVFGRVFIEPGVFVGVGARIVNESNDVMTIGAGATIAAGAVVLRSVEPGETLAGNPATDLRSLAKRRSS